MRTVTSGLRIIFEGSGVVPVLVQEEVEAPHLVGAVVRAVPRAHAAVVDHVVQALVAVHGGRHRADHLAGGVLAVHAEHRLVVGRRGSPAGPRSSGRPGSSASRGRGRPGPCPPPGCCSRTGRPITHALQPMQAFRSIAMPHACPSYFVRRVHREAGFRGSAIFWTTSGSFARSARVTARTTCRSRACACAVASIVQWSCVQAIACGLAGLRPPRAPPVAHSASLVRSA